LLHSCAEIHAAIELLFGVMSGVTQGIHVLDRGPCASRRRVDFGVICPHWSNGFNGIYCNRNVFDLCVKVNNISVRTTSLKSTFHWLSEGVLNSRSMLGFESNWQKCNS